MKSFSDYIIKKDAIINNLNCYKNLCLNTKICAVVKANAYGIGLNKISKIIDDNVNFYAVSCFVEAAELRKSTTKPILILNFIPYKNLKKCIDKNISITIYSIKQLKVIKKFLQNIKYTNIQNKLKIHLAINSGMNRIGFDDKDEFLQSLNIIKKMRKKIDIEGIYTHFFNAEDVLITKKQVSKFNNFVEILGSKFDIRNIIKHVCNSLGAIKYTECGFDMVRVGIGLYTNLDVKYQKNDNVKHIKNYLNDVIEIKSKIIKVTHIKKGEYVGYGKNYQASKNMVIGTVPLGYADGIFRNYAKQGKVICNGKYCKIIGNICMDMFMIDLSNTNAKVFDTVTIIGQENSKKISILDVANNCDTISYEILTNLKSKRMNVLIK